MNIGLIQIGAQEEKEKSLALAEDYILKAAGSGADIIMLPEMFNCPYNTENFPIYAEPEGGPCWTRMSDAARNCGKYLIAGSMPECDSKGRVYNTSYVFGPDGNQLAKHRKMHLFDIAVKGGQYFRESETLTAGDQVTIFDTEFGRFGVMICYDIRYFAPGHWTIRSLWQDAHRPGRTAATFPMDTPWSRRRGGMWSDRWMKGKDYWSVRSIRIRCER